MHLRSLVAVTVQELLQQRLAGCTTLHELLVYPLWHIEAAVLLRRTHPAEGCGQIGLPSLLWRGLLEAATENTPNIFGPECNCKSNPDW